MLGSTVFRGAVFAAAALIAGLIAAQSSHALGVPVSTPANVTKYSNGTVCRFYDGYTPNGNNAFSGVAPEPRRGTLCVAPSTAYPQYRGAAIVDDATIVDGRSFPCNFSLFPYDSDEPRPMVGCIGSMPPPVPVWHLVNGSWSAGAGGTFAYFPGTHTYVYPMTSTWRWVYNRGSGWNAIQAKHVFIRWFIPSV